MGGYPAIGIDELKAIFKPYDAALMEPHAGARAVNSVKKDPEGCIEPIEVDAIGPGSWASCSPLPVKAKAK